MTGAPDPVNVVDLIGAGPGDPDLLTLRAESALAAATVVVSDATVAHLAETFAPRATLIVSPAGGPLHAPADGAAAPEGATVDGDGLRVLIGAARRGERVVRLYRGDPWLHPAYAVESSILTMTGVAHVTVPGPAVEVAVPAAAGVALHRPGLTAAVTVAAPAALPAAVDPARTLVTVTDDVAAVARRLARAGDPDMPAVAVTTDGGAPRAHRGALGALGADRALGPGVLVVGAAAGAVPGAVAGHRPPGPVVAGPRVAGPRVAGPVDEAEGSGHGEEPARA